MRIAIVCSAHGFGHVTRQLVVADALAARGATPTIFSAAPPAIVGPRAHERWTVDVGIAQRDSLTEDVAATRARLADVVTDARIDALATRLADFDGVVVDIAPPALEAARRAGVPAVAVGNFDWAWIYRHYPALQDWAARYAAWQAPHRALALAPGPGLTGFAGVETFGVVGRVATPGEHGVGADEGRDEAPRGGALRGGSAPLSQEEEVQRSVLVCFGGFGLDGVDAWLPRMPGVTWIVAPPMAPVDRPDVRYVDDVPFPALVATADALLTKPGYGIYAEAALAGTPIVWVDRGPFPEAPYLEAALRARGDVKVEAGRGPVAARIADALRARWSRPRPTRVAGGVAPEIAARILDHLR